MSTIDRVMNRVEDKLDRHFDALCDHLRAIIDDPSVPEADRAAAASELRALQAERHGLGDVTTRNVSDHAEAAARWHERLDDLVEAGETYLGDGEGGGLFGEIHIGGRVGTLSLGRPNLADGRGLMDLYESNPGRFRDMWMDLGAEERQLAMFSLQQEAQVNAQMTTMITNLMQSQHSAAMAVARNLSV